MSNWGARVGGDDDGVWSMRKGQAKFVSDEWSMWSGKGSWGAEVT